MGKFKDLTGTIYPSGIEVLEFVEMKHHVSYWKCKCHCGNIFTARGADLNNGHTKSCGCVRNKKIKEIGKQNAHKIIDLTGQRFGQLTVIKQTNKRDSYRSVIWLCHCDCGNDIELSSHVLRQGQISCGCQKSKGELKIAQILLEANIPFATQQQFETCIFPDTQWPARFDFYVNNQYLIEFDGIQHFNQRVGWNNEEQFLKIQKHDIFKNQWCKNNNIPLIRIPYTQLNNLQLADLQLETSTFLI